MRECLPLPQLLPLTTLAGWLASHPNGKETQGLPPLLPLTPLITNTTTAIDTRQNPPHNIREYLPLPQLLPPTTLAGWLASHPNGKETEELLPLLPLTPVVLPTILVLFCLIFGRGSFSAEEGLESGFSRSYSDPHLPQIRKDV